MTTTHDSSVAKRPVETGSRHVLVWVFLILFAVFMSWAIWTTKPLQSANDRSRWSTVWSLVERGTYQIDEIQENNGWFSIDKVRHQPAGTNEYHFYSSKPPLFSTMVAGLYWIQKHICGLDMLQQTQVACESLLLIVNLLPFCLGLLALEKSLRTLHVRPLTAAIVFGMAAFTSMLNPFLTTLNNHTPAATSLLFCLAALIRLESKRTTPDQTSTKDFAIVGFTAALVCCFELPAALFGLLSFFIVVGISFRKTLIAYTPAALLPLAAFLITNVICTDGIKPFYAYYGTEKYEYIHEGVPSYWMNPKGIDANAETALVYLFHCVLGHHGILSLTPVFLLVLPGWFWILRNSGATHWKKIGLLGVFLSVVILTFYLTRTKNYNYGGNTSALRWVLWLVPFWWYAMTPTVDRLLNSKRGVLVLLILATASGFSAIDSLQTAWRPNWIYRVAETQGWINYRTQIPPFAPRRFSVLRPTAALQRGVEYRFQGSEDAAGRSIVLTLVDLPDAGFNRMNSDNQVLRIEVRGRNQKVTQSAEVIVQVSKLKSGETVSLAMKSWSADLLPTKERQPFALNDLQDAEDWVIKLVQGLPSSKAYRSASERYMKYAGADGQTTAIRCDRGAARVPVEHPEFGDCWHRCDVFYSDELAFGVARWTITLTSADTGDVVEKETWTCRNLP